MASISEILLEQGRRAAEARQARGSLWGSAVAGLSQVPGQIIADRQAQQAAQYQMGRQQQADQRTEEELRIKQSAEGRATAELDDQRAEADRMRSQEAQAKASVKAWAAAHVETGELKPEEADRLVTVLDMPGGLKTVTEHLSKLPEPFTLSPGQQRFGPNGQPIANVPEPPKPPVMREVVVRGPNGRPIKKLVSDAEMQGGIEQYEKPDAPNKPDTDLVQVMGPNGVPIWTRKSEAAGMPAAQAPRAVTGQERQALAYYNRAKDAVETITTPKAGGDSLEQKIAKSGLVQQGRLQLLHNVFQSADGKSYRQAQRAFTEARLRKESGAAIPTAEYENDAKTYFAQPGDDGQIIEQKRASRETVLNGLKFGSGKAYDEYYGEPNVSPARSGGVSVGKFTVKVK